MKNRTTESDRHRRPEANPAAAPAGLAAVGIFVAVFFLVSCKPDPVEFIPSDYSSWARINREELDYPVPGHESNYRIIYMNDVGREADAYPFPEGTKIVKEIYSGLDPAEDEKPIMLTTMVKAPDHESARGGWLWILVDGETGDETIITEAFCLTCHDNANEEHPYADGNPNDEFRDYVFFVPGYGF